MPHLFRDFIQELGSSNQVESGILQVPENHKKPNGKKIHIAYLILKALKKRSKKFPLIYISGGPGGQSITKARIKTWFNNPIRQDRDIILLDQRGIGFSSPLPNMSSNIFRIMFNNFSLEEEQKHFEKVIIHYRERCKKEGFHLSNYNSYQITRDVVQLMNHLGYEKYNLYGVSSGSRIARILQEECPEYLHTVTYNSPTLLHGDFLIDRLVNYSKALESIFKFCGQNQVEHPSPFDLRKDYWSVMMGLDEVPIKISIDGIPYLINARDGLYLVKRQLHANDAREKILQLIEAFKIGKGKIIEEIIRAEKHFMKYINLTMLMAVERAEMVDSRNTPEVVKARYDKLPLVPVEMGFFHSLYHTLEKLHNNTLTAHQLKASNIPTLITVNYYDPITPPEDAIIFGEKLTNAHLFILDESGHGHGDFNCRSRIMKGFMNQPGEPLDTSCLKIYGGG